MIVDRVFDTEEIVVKPVAPILLDIPFYSGNTILGDQRRLGHAWRRGNGWPLQRCIASRRAWRARYEVCEWEYQMNPRDFELLTTLLKERSGLVVNQDKAYLLESRLMPVARKHGMKGLVELADLIRTRPDESVINEVTEAMTTNESFFFRDIKPFDLFRDTVLPQLLENRAAKKSFRIWCAAASNGQEPYSLAMILNEAAGKFAGWRYEILGTDISNEVLEKARAGLYSQFEVQRGLPIQLLMKYFTKSGDKWRVANSLRTKVQYKLFNLLDDFGPLGRFDVVYCRNVLIYFDLPTKTAILDKISRLMPDDGVLFLGGAETVLGISDKFKPMPGQRGIYILEGNAAGIPKPAALTPVAVSS